MLVTYLSLLIALGKADVLRLQSSNVLQLSQCQIMVVNSVKVQWRFSGEKPLCNIFANNNFDAGYPLFFMIRAIKVTNTSLITLSQCLNCYIFNSPWFFYQLSQIQYVKAGRDWSMMMMMMMMQVLWLSLWWGQQDLLHSANNCSFFLDYCLVVPKVLSFFERNWTLFC